MPGHMSVQYITEQPSPARAKQTNSAIFSAPSTDACSERANQLVSNTFRLLIITLRQARHQYEGYWRTQHGHWAAVPSMARMAAQPSIFLAPIQLYLMADMALIVLISLLHFYLLYKAEAEAEAAGGCCSGCAVLSASGLFICAICLSARQLITFAPSPPHLFSFSLALRCACT